MELRHLEIGKHTHSTTTHMREQQKNNTYSKGTPNRFATTTAYLLRQDFATDAWGRAAKAWGLAANVRDSAANTWGLAANLQQDS